MPLCPLRSPRRRRALWKLGVALADQLVLPVRMTLQDRLRAGWPEIFDLLAQAGEVVDARTRRPHPLPPPWLKSDGARPPVLSSGRHGTHIVIRAASVPTPSATGKGRGRGSRARSLVSAAAKFHLASCFVICVGEYSGYVRGWWRDDDAANEKGR
jgi:hypothetical protein